MQAYFFFISYLIMKTIIYEFDDELASKFQLNHCTESRNNYVKLCLSIPDSWEDNTSLQLTNDHDSNLFATVKEKAFNLWRSCRNVYINLINGSGTIKQQVRWSNELGVDNYSINWSAINCNNYYHRRRRRGVRALKLGKDLF